MMVLIQMRVLLGGYYGFKPVFSVNIRSIATGLQVFGYHLFYRGEMRKTGKKRTKHS